MKEKGKWTGWLWWGIGVVLLILVAVAIYKLSLTKETYTYAPSKSDSKIDALICTATEPEDAFFLPNVSGQGRHELKVTFREQKPDKISYRFDGIYDSDKSAEVVESQMHVKYNSYIGEHNISASTINSSFSVADNKLYVSLFTNIKDLSMDTVPLFFLDMNEFQKVRSYSSQEFAEIYKNKGFACTIRE